jgi:hypothetical protein
MYDFNNKGKTLPNIYRPLPSASSEIAVYIPYSPYNRDYLRDILPSVRFQFNSDIKMWTMSRKHLVKVATWLAEKYGSCTVYADMSFTEKCTTQCKDAKKRKVVECTCVCGGFSHGDGWPEGWKLVSDEGLTTHTTYRTDEILVTPTDNVSTNLV